MLFNSFSFLLFFPTVVILHALTPARWRQRASSPGLRLMLWGFLQKLVIADRLAEITTPVFAAPRTFLGPTLVLAAVAFA